MPLLTGNTVLGLQGTPQSAGPYSGRGEETTLDKAVSDTLRLVVTEGNFSSLELDVNDGVVPRITDRGVAGLSRSVTETLRPRITDAIVQVVKSGSFPKAVSDTIRPRITEAITGYSVAIGVSDSIVPIITDTQTFDGSAIKTVTDTLIPVITENYRIDQYVSDRAFAVTDTLIPVIWDTASESPYNDVDKIEITLRPCGVIRLMDA